MTNTSQPLLREKTASRCKHFNGLFQQSCKAGVAYDSVIDTSNLPEYKLPCIKADNCSERCAQVYYPTPEEVNERVQKAEARMQLMTDRLRAGSCPQCGTHMTGQKTVHGCSYALPCSCRIGSVAL